MAKPAPNPYRRLLRQIFLVLLTLGLVPVVASAIAGTVASRERLESRAKSVLEAMF